MEATKMAEGPLSGTISEKLAGGSFDRAGPANAAAAADQYAKRELTWDELTDMQRIARMRNELILLSELVQSQQALIDRLMVHQHLPNGEMGVSLRYSGRGFEGGSRRSRLS